MSLILSSSCWFSLMPPPDASARRTATCSSSLVFRYHRHISCTSLCLSSFPLFDSLCLSDSVFVRSHPCFSRQGSLNDGSDSLSAFVVMWLCRFSVRCKRCASWAASRVSVSFNVRRQDIESSGFNLWRSFNHNPGRLGSRSFFVSCDFLRQLQFWSHHLPRSATQTFPIRRFPSIAQCLSCPTFASHNSILRNTQNCSCSIMVTNEILRVMRLAKGLTSSSPILRNQTFSPNCAIGFLHLRPSLLISLVFPSLPILVLFRTCAAKRGSQLRYGLSSAIRTLVFCSAEIRRFSTLSFHFSTSHFHTTVGPVITLRWSLRNHFHFYTCVNHRIFECFRTRFMIAFQNDSAKNKIFDETHKK